MTGRAHRALPLAEVERRAQAARTPWPNVCPSCNTGTPGYCDCVPAAGASSVSGIEDEEPYNLRQVRRPAPPPVPWRELGAGLLVLFFAVSCFHVIATATQPAPQKVAKR